MCKKQRDGGTIMKRDKLVGKIERNKYFIKLKRCFLFIFVVHLIASKKRCNWMVDPYTVWLIIALRALILVSLAYSLDFCWRLFHSACLSLLLNHSILSSNVSRKVSSIAFSHINVSINGSSLSTSVPYGLSKWYLLHLIPSLVRDVCAATIQTLFDKATSRNKWPSWQTWF